MREVQRNIFIITLILVCLGVVMVYSSSAFYAKETFSNSTFFLKRHLLHLALGSFFLLGIFLTDIKFLREKAKFLLILSLLGLVLVLFSSFGKEIGGARRWLKFGRFSFQPSEFAQWALILYVADFLSRKTKWIKNPFVFIIPIVVLALVVLFIILEPDLGMALTTALVIFLLLFASGARISHLSMVLVLASFVFSLLIFSAPYRRARIISFLNPWANSKGAGYQLVQSQIALGSGGVFGVGLGEGRQKLFYLPASYTDFIFSILGEELGFIGSISVIILFILLIIEAANIAINSSGLFSQLLSLGIAATMGLKVIINIGACSGLLPTKGIPLPFISYGGTALVFNLINIGILLNLAKEEH